MKALRSQQLDELVVLVWCISDPKMSNELRSQLSFFYEIGEGRGILLQMRAKKLMCECMDPFEFGFFIAIVGDFFEIMLVFVDVEVLEFCEFFDCISKVEPLYLLHKCDHIPAFSTAKAFEDLFGWRDHKRWGFLIVKRATSRKIAPGSFEGDIFSDDIYDIRR